MVRRVAAFAAFAALALGVSSALGAEAELPGPKACSAVVENDSARPWRVDLWVQCNYQVSEIATKSANRKLRRVSSAPELFGTGPTDNLSCRLRSRAVECGGRLKPFARVHIRFNVSEYACNRPMMRLTVDAFGGETCEPGENCSEIGFATRTPAAVGNIHGSCGGR